MGTFNERLKMAASEITDLWWARPDQGGAAKTRVVEEILRRHLGSQEFQIPNVMGITRARFGTGWGTDVHFENGVVLGFVGKLKAAVATEMGIRHYRAMLAAGFSDADLKGLFAKEAK